MNMLILHGLCCNAGLMVWVARLHGMSISDGLDGQNTHL